MLGGRLPRTRLIWIATGALLVVLAVGAFFALRPGGTAEPEMVAFSQFPEQKQRVIDDPSLWDTAVDEIIRYVTEGSFDTYMWQTLERKAAFIAQVSRGDAPDRPCITLVPPCPSVSIQTRSPPGVHATWQALRLVETGKDYAGIILERGKKVFETRGQDADAVWARWQLPTMGLTPNSLRSAVKMYIALRRELEEDEAIGGQRPGGDDVDEHADQGQDVGMDAERDAQGNDRAQRKHADGANGARESHRKLSSAELRTKN